jgi:DNA invertase Pin-like site-specific DNA recombinase
MEPSSQPARMIGYARVSTVEQALSGLGLEDQQRVIRATAELRGWDLLEIVVDAGESGSTLERPGIRGALERIARFEVDGLVVAKLDRLSRSNSHSIQLFDWFHDVGATLAVVDFNIDTSTPSGRLISSFMASLAQWEREMTAERTRAALAALRARGQPVGPPAVADHPELAELIKALREQGLSHRAIAAHLNAERIPTLRGGAEWRPSSIHAILGYRRRKPRRKAADLPEPPRRR